MEPRAPTATPRPARDTLDEVRDVARDLRSLDERITQRLNTGAESFTRTDMRVSAAEATAKAANELALRAAAAKPIPWTRVIPIAIVLLGCFAGVVGTMNRTPSREFVEERVASLAARLRDLEGDLVAVQKEMIALRAALESTRDLLSARLAALEKASPRRGLK